MKKPNYIELLDRFLRGETSQEEEHVLRTWFQNHLSEKEIVAFYQLRWGESAKGDLSPETQKQMHDRIKSRMHENQLREKSVTKEYWIKGYQGLKYASIFLLCIGIGVGTHLYTHRLTSDLVNQQEYIIRAERGQRANITLPDGTKVWLNSHSELSYTNQYGVNNRLVSLTGEAYFEVAKDEKKRFIVKADEIEVEALGTSFNVKAYQEDPQIIATLFTGKIRASIGREEVILLPDQYASFDRVSHKLLAVGHSENLLYARMWRENKLAFESQTLGEIAVLLNRMYNVQLEFKSNHIKQYRFSGVIKNNSLDNVLEIISLTAPITYTSRGDTIMLSDQ